MREFVEILIEALVGHSSGWEIKERLRDDQVVVLDLLASKEDMAAIVGKGGTHIAAVRTLLRAAQADAGARYVLETRAL